MLFYCIIFFVIIISIGIVFLIPYYVNNKNLSPIKFFIAYWGIIMIIEAIYIFNLDQPQFIPPSLFFNYIYGTILFAVYSVQCIFYKMKKRIKLTYIGYALVLNYFIIPIILSFISY